MVIIRIDRIGRKIIREHRVVGRERRRHHFIKANPRPGQRAVHAANEARSVGVIGPIEQTSLLHRAAELASAHNFEHVVHPAAEFLLHVGAAGGQRRREDRRSQKREVVSHRFLVS